MLARPVRARPLPTGHERRPQAAQGGRTGARGAHASREATIATAFFDLDRTLIDCNSATLWVRAEVRAGRLRLVDAAWAVWWIAKYQLGTAKLEGAYEAAVRMLEGQPEALLEERTRTWFDREIAHRLRPGARKALDAHRAAGDRLVVCTSSSTYAADAACRHFGLTDRVATRMQVVDGVFTGAVAELALGPCKLDATRAWCARDGVDLRDATFYTDSVSDLALMEAVARPVAVHPDRPLAAIAKARGWAIADWGDAPHRPR